MRVLVVDDEPAIVELLVSACVADGHDVASSDTSSEALDYLARHTVDMIISDIHMPAPDGLQLMREALALQPHLVGLAITGYETRYSLEDVIGSGASDLVFKPFRISELRARIARAQRRCEFAENLNKCPRTPQTEADEPIVVDCAAGPPTNVRH